MKDKFIFTFWFLYDFIHIYLIGGNTQIDRSYVDVVPGGDVTIKNNYLDFYLGYDHATIKIIFLSFISLILCRHIFGKEKSISKDIPALIIMILVSLIIFRLRVDIIY